MVLKWLEDKANDVGNWIDNEILDPVKEEFESAGRSIDDEIFQPVKSEFRKGFRSIDEEIFQPVFDDIDDSYKEYVRPYMSEIGTVVATMLGLPPQVGATLGQMFEEGGLGGSGVGGAGGAGGAGGVPGGSVAGIQARGYEQARQEAEQSRRLTRGAFQPYMQMGTQAMNPLLQELGIQTPQSVPSYQVSQGGNRNGFPAARSGGDVKDAASRAMGLLRGQGGPNYSAEDKIARYNAQKTGTPSDSIQNLINQWQSEQQVKGGNAGVYAQSPVNYTSSQNNPMLQGIQDQVKRDLFNNRSAQGIWNAGDTPGVMARALLEPAYKMQQDRINNLFNVTQLGAGSTGQFAGSEARMTDSIMKSAIGQNLALAAGQQVANDKAAAAQKQRTDAIGGLLEYGGNFLKNMFFGDDTGGQTYADAFKGSGNTSQTEFDLTSNIY